MSFLLLVFGVIGFAAWAFWYYSDDQSIRRQLRNAPTKRIAELLGGERRLMRGATHTISLDPRTAPAHIYRVGRWRRRERDFDYYA